MSKEIWLATNAERRTGRRNGMYASVVLPFITSLSGLPVAIEDPEHSIAEGSVNVPIPAGVVAVTVMGTSAWHGVGDGRAVPVPLLELGIGLAAHAMPDGLHIGIDDGTHLPRQRDPIERWLRGARDSYERQSVDERPRVAWETIDGLLNRYIQLARDGKTL